VGGKEKKRKEKKERKKEKKKLNFVDQCNLCLKAFTKQNI